MVEAATGHGTERRGLDRALDWATALALAVAILGPTLLHRGYTLRGDMVFVPDMPWKPAWLGLDGSVPRSVPMDAVVWLLGQVLPGDIVQKGMLAGALVALALGIARLLRDLGAFGRLAGVVLGCWNPYVAERLAIGQWAFVAGYAVFPWLVRTSLRLRDGERGGIPGSAVLLGLAGLCAPSMGLLAAFVVLCILLTRPGVKPVLAALSMALVANLPWIVPGVLRAQIRPPGGQFGDFGAAAESGAGVLASVLSGGGIWKTSVVPVERTHAAVVLASALIALLALWMLVRRRRADPAVTGLVVAAVVVTAVAWITSWTPVAGLLAEVTDTVPAAGIVRDSTRYLAPLVLAVAVGFGALVDAFVRWIRARRGAGAPVGVTCVLLPVFVLPTLAWGVHGFLQPSSFPDSWRAAATALGRAQGRAGDHGGATIVLPWHGSYRGFAWTDRHAVLDPAPRFFPGPVLIDDRIFLGDRVLAGEDPYLSRVGAALAGPRSGRALRDLGVRWVLVERDNAAVVPDSLGGRVIDRSGDLALLDLGRPRASVRAAPPWAPVVAADVLAALMVGAGCVIWRKTG